MATAAFLAFGVGSPDRADAQVSVKRAAAELMAFEEAVSPRIAQAQAELEALQAATRRSAAEGADLTSQAARAARLAELAETLERAERAVATLRTRLMLIGPAPAEAASDVAAVAPLPPERPRVAADRLPAAPLPWATAAFAAQIDALAAVPGNGVPETAVVGAKIETLETEIAALDNRADRVLGELGEAARESIDDLGSMLVQAGLDVDRVMAAARADFSGQGGPFEPFDPEAPADDTDMRLAALMSNLEQANLMRIAVDKLPFGRPVEVARLTSGFGKRRDPFRRIWSMHSGMDFAAPSGTPIYTTASGIVSFSGGMGGYGRIVIIKHAFGYETRYAHLKRALVEVGQRVERGDLIGEMGRSGRATGTHLHYEVRIDEKPVNPRKFVESAREIL